MSMFKRSQVRSVSSRSLKPKSSDQPESMWSVPNGGFTQSLTFKSRFIDQSGFHLNWMGGITKAPLKDIK